MPPLPPLANVIKIQLLGNTGEATPLPWANILHVVYTSAPPSATDIASLATAVLDSWSTNMAPECISSTKLTEVVCTDLSSATAASATAASTVPGTRGDDEIPAQVAYLVTYPISTRYRGGHPRQYLLVGGNADFLDAAHWSTAFTAEVINHWHIFLEAFTAATYGSLVVTTGCSPSYYMTDYATTPPTRVRRVIPIYYPWDPAQAVGHQQMATIRRRVGRHRR